MKIIESINSISAPRDIRLFRGIFGKSSLDSISTSIMASCTPSYTTAVRFANQYSHGLSSLGDKSLISFHIKKGAPIIPLMFSVKTSIKGYSAEEL